MAKFSHWTSVVLLLVLLIVAVIFRLEFFQPIGAMAQDESLYAWYATLIHTNPGLIFSRELIEYHPPLLAILLQPGHWISPPEVGYRLISMMINLLGIIAIFLLGDRIGGRFLGVFAGIALTISPFYVSFANLINTDVPVVVFSMFFLLAVLSSSRKKKSIMTDIAIGVLGAACIGVKWSGVIIIPIFVLYALFAEQGTCTQRLRTVRLPLSILFVFLSALFVIDYFRLQSVVPHSALHTFLDGAYYKGPFWSFVHSFPGLAFPPSLFWGIFFFYGLLMLLFSPKREDILLQVWFWVCLVGISLSQEKDIRYGLLILPSSILILGRGIQILLSRICPQGSMMVRVYQGVFIALFLSYFLLSFPEISKILIKRSHTYMGFAKAGQWIKQQSAPDMVIIAASIRQIRYYSGIEYAELGGRIHFPPEQRDAFEKWMGEVKGKVILVSDVWEATQPDWLWPSRKNYDYLYGLGFRLVTVIQEPVADNFRNIIWIYSREKGV